MLSPGAFPPPFLFQFRPRFFLVLKQNKHTANHLNRLYSNFLFSEVIQWPILPYPLTPNPFPPLSPNRLIGDRAARICSLMLALVWPFLPDCRANIDQGCSRRGRASILLNITRFWTRLRRGLVLAWFPAGVSGMSTGRYNLGKARWPLDSFPHPSPQKCGATLA